MVFKCQEDSYLKEFISNVKSCQPTIFSITKNGKKCDINGYEVILDETIFFPEGGGQPSDSGFINESKVYYVARNGDLAVHFIDKPVNVNDNVKQVIDWNRRFDHMQHHSGQHLISAIFSKEHNIETLSWWLGEEICYVELETPGVNDDLLNAVENRANELIRRSEKVTVTVFGANTSEEDLKHARSARGLPADHVGDIRVINIDGINDNNMCCGTHVSNLSQLQAIKLLYSEKSKRKGNSLVYFLCGNRILQQFMISWKREQQITSLLSGKPEQHFELIEKLVKTTKLMNKNLQSVLKEMAITEARKLKNTDPIPSFYCLHQKEAEPSFMNTFIRELGTEKILLLLSTGDEKTNGDILVYGPPKDVEELGPKISIILNGKGAGKGNRYQAKVSNMKDRPKAIKLIEEYYKEVKEA